MSLICKNCGITLPNYARFCFNCGAEQATNIYYAHSDLKYELDFEKDVAKQIFTQFLQALNERVTTEHQASRHADYVEILYQSGFGDTVQNRAHQLAEETSRIKAQYPNNAPKISHLLDRAYQDLLDYFIIYYGQSLNTFPLPEAILKYQYAQLGQVDLLQMVLDYLDFSRESETVYTDLLSVPLDKLRNAGQSFLFPAPDERILFICDQTLFGSFKLGFAMTENALYWKAQFQKAYAIQYQNLLTIERQQDWLHINGQFFNVNPAINLKMMRLLKKLKLLHRLHY